MKPISTFNVRNTTTGRYIKVFRDFDDALAFQERFNRWQKTAQALIEYSIVKRDALGRFTTI